MSINFSNGSSLYVSTCLGKIYAARVSSAADPSPFLRCFCDCIPLLGGGGAMAASVLLVAIAGDFFLSCFEGVEVSCSLLLRVLWHFQSGSVASGRWLCLPVGGSVCFGASRQFFLPVFLWLRFLEVTSLVADSIISS
jgi:hypothetical protein